MFVAQRRRKIKELLIQERSVKVADLVKTFSVSEETIRRDLSQLEREGILRKDYGGAILVEDFRDSLSSVPPVQHRVQYFTEEKEAIAEAAASLVGPGDIVVMDAGSTTLCLAKHLGGIDALTVLTNGMNVAEQCSQNENANVFVIGGKLIRKSMSLVGSQAEGELRKYNADIAFLGASGVSTNRGFGSFDLYEAEMKKAMVAAGRKVVILADHSKFEKQALISFASFKDVDVLITSDLVDPHLLRSIEQAGVRVIVCSVRGALLREEA
ncbi:DeoR/GlpR transcriptional regulator [Paenibacillus antri]|uniref:DeoR/GlpR transcriptional regulator n=1 Tax=Paenibacillus antri TaxID=2582848 RepID=A0A5R9GEY8_9BACL|nr:DeoR/GlpR family DNA-binding transcription regulator [Paenibacillus antri]TLS52936.1 DeoR/GlpR transcriptional regulator [Paenibacillus antri]